MKRIVNKLAGRLDVHMLEVVRGASLAFILKILAAGIAFAFNIILARMLGAGGSGLYYLSLTLVIVTATIGRLGMENTLVRYISLNKSSGEFRKITGIYNKSILYSLLATSVIAIVVYKYSGTLSHKVFEKPEIESLLTLMSFAIIPLALLTLHASALQGMKRIAESIAVLSILSPLIACMLIIIFVPLYGISAAALAYVASTVVTLLIGRAFWRKAVRSFDSEKPYFETKILFGSSIPLYISVLLNMVIIWSPVLLLGIWETSENIGIYSAASRTAMLTSFVLIAVNSIAAPKFAELYQANNIDALEIVAKNSVKLMLMMASPILLLMILVPEFILVLFGEKFKEGALILQILAVGQFVNVITGSVGYLLMMTGNEKDIRNNVLVVSIVGIAANLILIKYYGVLGAAFGAAGALIIQNIHLMFMVWKKLGIITFPWIGKST